MRFLLILVFLSLPWLVLAQEQSALYKIEWNGLKQASYVFGTINFLPQFGYFLPVEVKTVLEKSEVYVNKLSMKPKVQRKFSEALKLPEGGSIDSYLNVEDQEKLKEIIETYGGRNQAYKNFYSKLQPVILVTTTTALTLQNNITYPERELEDIAKHNKLKFVSLSNVDEEVEAFKVFPISEQVEALSFAVNNFSGHIKDYKKMVRSYNKEQDLEEVKKITFRAFKNNQAFEDAYYNKRTADWLPQIEKVMKSRPSFIALGVAHLVGEKGLISLLKAAGYEVSTVILDFVPAKTSN